ncbi:MAG: GerMN domain-containing protein [Treponema sp.]
MKKKNKKFFSLNVCFWLAFVLVMSFLFFINRAIIAKAVTKIKDSPSFSKPEIIKNDIKETIEGSNEVPPLEKKDKVLKEDNEKIEDVSMNDEMEENINENERIESTTQQDIQEDKKVQHKNEMRNIDVYFASVSDSGIVTREKCVREVERSLSPMVDSIKVLLQGPTTEEAKHGIRSFIPADTKLLSASIKDEMAFINLSEDFQFNRYGVEGYNIQLQQIVFTVCSFPTVKSVQFLIDGQKRDFIGSEGVWIGSPLNVNSF